MSKTVHLCIDVRGVLHWDKRELRNRRATLFSGEPTRRS